MQNSDAKLALDISNIFKNLNWSIKQKSMIDKLSYFKILTDLM